MIEYPSSFPGSAHAKVEHAIAEAEIHLARDQRSVVNFVLQILEVFVREFTEVVDRQLDSGELKGFDSPRGSCSVG